MTNLRIKWALFVFTVLLFGFYLLPSIRYYSLPATPAEGFHADTTGFAVGRSTVAGLLGSCRDEAPRELDEARFGSPGRVLPRVRS